MSRRVVGSTVQDVAANWDTPLPVTPPRLRGRAVRAVAAHATGPEDLLDLLDVLGLDMEEVSR